MLKNYITLLFLFLVSFSAKATELSSSILETEAQTETEISSSNEEGDIDEYVYENLDEEILEDSIENDNDISSNNKPKPVVYYQSPIKRVAKFVWGEPVDNAILTGMLSYHADAESRREDRWNHNLIGLQYKGLIASTFINSHNKQSVFVAFGRNVINTPILHSKLRFQAGYKIGLIYGYKNTPVFNILGITPAPLPFVGLSYRRVAFEIIPIPSRNPVISANMRINLYPPENPKKTKVISRK